MELLKITSDNLKKADCRGLSTLYLYYLENGKKACFDLPLFVDDNGKGVLSVETFKRVFYAFCMKIGKYYKADIKSGSDGDESKYNVVRVSHIDCDELGFEAMFSEPKQADLKRESSKKTSEKAQAKKEQKEKEIESNNAWNLKASKMLIDLVIGKYKLNVPSDKLNELEKDIIKVLERV